MDQINGRSECVDSTDNSSKPSSEPASHVARQRLESTEKKKISGKVTKSLSASALSLMIPGGRETTTRMKLCDFACGPDPSPGMLLEIRVAGSSAWRCPERQDLRVSGPPTQHAGLFLPLPSAARDEAGFLPTKPDFFFCFLSFPFLSPPPSQVK